MKPIEARYCEKCGYFDNVESPDFCPRCEASSKLKKIKLIRFDEHDKKIKELELIIKNLEDTLDGISFSQ